MNLKSGKEAQTAMEKITEALKALERIEAETEEDAIAEIQELSHFALGVSDGPAGLHQVAPDLSGDMTALYASTQLYLYRIGVSPNWTDSEAALIATLDRIIPNGAEWTGEAPLQ